MSSKQDTNPGVKTFTNTYPFRFILYIIPTMLSWKTQTNDGTLLKSSKGPLYTAVSKLAKISSMVHKPLCNPILIYCSSFIPSLSSSALTYTGFTQLLSILFIAHAISRLFDFAHVVSSA